MERPIFDSGREIRGEGTLANLSSEQVFAPWFNAHQPPLRASSRRIYAFFLQKFLQWCVGEKKSLKDFPASIDSEDIEQFLRQLSVKREQRERYFTVLVKALAAVEEQRIIALSPDNQADSVSDPPADRFEPEKKDDTTQSTPVYKFAQAADPMAKSWRNTQRNAPKQFLTPSEQTKVIEAVLAEVQRLDAQAQPEADSVLRPTARQWQQARDCAIVALLLGCGLRAAELIALRVSAVENGLDADQANGSELDFPTRLHVGQYRGERGHRQDPNKGATHAWKGEGAGPDRVLPIPKWTAAALKLWIKFYKAAMLAPDQFGQDQANPLTRADLKSRFDQFQAQRLFSASLATASDPAQPLMGSATLARDIRRWERHLLASPKAKISPLKSRKMVAAQDEGDHIVLSAQKLRNSFGAHLFLSGAPESEVEMLMGYAPGAASAYRLKESWTVFYKGEKTEEEAS